MQEYTYDIIKNLFEQKGFVQISDGLKHDLETTMQMKNKDYDVKDRLLERISNVQYFLPGGKHSRK